MQVLKRISLSVSLIFALLSFCQGQNIQFTSIELVVFDMAQHNIYESKTVGFASVKSKQYDRFQQLLTMATPDQLLNLATNHNNAVIRLYSFQALKQKNISIPNSLLEKFKNDQTLVDVFMGCIRSLKSVSNLVTSFGNAQMNFTPRFI